MVRPVFIITSLETQLRFYARLCHDTWHTALKWEYGSRLKVGKLVQNEGHSITTDK